MYQHTTRAKLGVVAVEEINQKICIKNFLTKSPISIQYFLLKPEKCQNMLAETYF